MIVYVESNFLLEMALEQAQYQEANAILSYAEQDIISLFLPGFAMCEPFGRIDRARSERNRFLDSLGKKFAEELSNSTPYQPILS